MAGTFSEQIGIVVDWFNTWNDCEKVVALYCLLRKLPPPQTKFLSQALNQIVASCSPVSVEEQANDPGVYIQYTVWCYQSSLMFRCGKCWWNLFVSFYFRVYCNVVWHFSTLC